MGNIQTQNKQLDINTFDKTFNALVVGLQDRSIDISDDDYYILKEILNKLN